MTHSSLGRIIGTGRQVDEVMFDALGQGSAEEFQGPLKYHFKAGGKRMRAAMVMLSCGAAGGRIQDSLKPAAVVEMIHNYSLVMDDMIDRGVLRRGKPTVRVRLGDSVSLLVAMSYREALDDLIQDSPQNQVVRKIAVQAMKEIIDGERLDLQFEQAGREDPYLVAHRIKRPSFQLYLRMIGKKTATLFRAAGELGAYSAAADFRVARALGDFGWRAGLAFQIMDDVLDVCGMGTGKERAKDVIEHKLGNAAILVAMKYLPAKQKSELRGILATPRVTRRQALKARQLVAKTPAETACREIAREYVSQARGYLSVLKSSKYSDSLASLADGIVSRTF